MQSTDPHRDEDLSALRQRLRALEDQQRRHKLHRLWGGAAIAVLLVLAYTQRAWSLACTSGLVCFAANTPARASEVNDNFTTLSTWLANKVGAAHDSNISTRGTLTAGAATLDSATISGTTNLNGTTKIATASVATLTGATTFSGDATFSSTLKVADSSGTYFTASKAGVEVPSLKVAGHRPDYSVSKGCNASTCTVSCNSGDKIKVAWGFHGTTPTGDIHFTSWNCGSALSWLGSCIGKDTCTMGAGCNTTGIYVECW